MRDLQNPNRRLMRSSVLSIIVLVFAMCACSSHPEKKLMGTWQSQSNPRYDLPAPMRGLHTKVMVQFLEDGTVLENERDEKNHWDQTTGTFRLIDPTHLKIDLGVGSTVYKLNWRDNDHVSLRLNDTKIDLERVK